MAIMIRDYPDSSPAITTLPPHLTATATTQIPSNQSLESNITPTHTPYAARARRISPQPIQASDTPINQETPLPQIPLVLSSPAGESTSRPTTEGYKPPPPKHPLVMPANGHPASLETGNLGLTSASVEGKMSAADLGGASMALQRSVRALDGVERIGSLLTLDLKSNEIKVSDRYWRVIEKLTR